MQVSPPRKRQRDEGAPGGRGKQQRVATDADSKGTTSGRASSGQDTSVRAARPALPPRQPPSITRGYAQQLSRSIRNPLSPLTLPSSSDAPSPSRRDRQPEHGAATVAAARAALSRLAHQWMQQLTRRLLSYERDHVEYEAQDGDALHPPLYNHYIALEDFTDDYAHKHTPSQEFVLPHEAEISKQNLTRMAQVGLLNFRAKLVYESNGGNVTFTHQDILQLYWGLRQHPLGCYVHYDIAQESTDTSMNDIIIPNFDRKKKVHEKKSKNERAKLRAREKGSKSKKAAEQKEEKDAAKETKEEVVEEVEEVESSEEHESEGARAKRPLLGMHYADETVKYACLIKISGGDMGFLTIQCFSSQQAKMMRNELIERMNELRVVTHAPIKVELTKSRIETITSYKFPFVWPADELVAENRDHDFVLLHEFFRGVRTDAESRVETSLALLPESKLAKADVLKRLDTFDWRQKNTSLMCQFDVPKASLIVRHEPNANKGEPQYKVQFLGAHRTYALPACLERFRNILRRWYACYQTAAAERSTREQGQLASLKKELADKSAHSRDELEKLKKQLEILKEREREKLNDLRKQLAEEMHERVMKAIKFDLKRKQDMASRAAVVQSQPRNTMAVVAINETDLPDVDSEDNDLGFPGSLKKVKRKLAQQRKQQEARTGTSGGGGKSTKGTGFSNPFTVPMSAVAAAAAAVASSAADTGAGASSKQFADVPLTGIGSISKKKPSLPKGRAPAPPELSPIATPSPSPASKGPAPKASPVTPSPAVAAAVLALATAPTSASHATHPFSVSLRPGARIGVGFTAPAMPSIPPPSRLVKPQSASRPSAAAPPPPSTPAAKSRPAASPSAPARAFASSASSASTASPARAALAPKPASRLAAQQARAPAPSLSLTPDDADIHMQPES